MTLENRIVKTADKVASLRSKMDALRDAKIPTQEYQEISAQIEKAEQKFNRLLEKQEQMQREGKDSGVAWDRLNAKMDEVGNTIRYAQGELQDLIDTGKAFTLGGNSQEYANLEQQLGYLENDYSVLIQRRNEFIRKHNIKPSGYERLQSTLSELRSSIIRIMNPIENMKTSFSAAADSMKDKMAGIAASVINGVVHPFKSLKSAISGTFSTEDKEQKKKSLLSKTMGKLGDAARNAAKSIKGALASSLKKSASSMLGFGKSAKSSNGELGKSLKTLLKYGFGIRSFYALINKFRNAVKEGFGNLAQYSEPVNSSLSSLKSSLTQLKNSLATAFAPILTTVAPLLNTLINMLSKAATYVGMFFSALTGQKIFTKAVAVQENYAAGLKKTSSAAKDAAKAMKGYLSPLDEINKFESPNTSVDSGGSGSDGGISPSDMFETVPIENSISGMVQKIKDMIYGEDWTGLGAYIASGLNSGLQKIYSVISWDNVGPKITYFINAFTTTINSLVDNINWELLGQTIGAGLDTALRSINLLVDGINWVNLGSKFSEGLNGFVNEVDFTEVGKFFGNKLKILNETLYGFVTNLNFENIGVAIANGLNGLGSRIDLSMLATSLYTTINGLFDMIGTFIETFDWAGLASNIYTGINTLFAGIDWANAAATLSELLIKLLDTITDLVAGVDWGQIGRDIIDFILNVDWLGLINSFLELGANIISGLLEGILGAIAGIGEWMKKNVFDPIVNWFKKLFGIHSPSTVMAEMGGFIISGLLQGLKDAIGTVLNWLKNIPIWFKEKFVQAYEYAKGAFSGIGKFFSNVWAAIKKPFADIAGWFKDKFSAAWQAVKNVFSSGGKVFDGIKDGILNGLKAVVNTLIRGINTVIAIPFNGINAALKGIRNVEILGWEPFSWIPTISVPQIPYLAQGSVIPANKEFLAVLGDQKHGTNIEAPLETIKQATEESLLNVLSKVGALNAGGNGAPVNITLQVTLDKKVLGQTMVDWGKLQQMAEGKNPFALGVT